MEWEVEQDKHLPQSYNIIQMFQEILQELQEHGLTANCQLHYSNKVKQLMVLMEENRELKECPLRTLGLQLIGRLVFHQVAIQCYNLK